MMDEIIFQFKLPLIYKKSYNTLASHLKIIVVVSVPVHAHPPLHLRRLSVGHLVVVVIVVVIADVVVDVVLGPLRGGNNSEGWLVAGHAVAGFIAVGVGWFLVAVGRSRCWSRGCLARRLGAAARVGCSDLVSAVLLAAPGRQHVTQLFSRLLTPSGYYFYSAVALLRF